MNSDNMKPDYGLGRGHTRASRRHKGKLRNSGPVLPPARENQALGVGRNRRMTTITGSGNQLSRATGSDFETPDFELRRTRIHLSPQQKFGIGRKRQIRLESRDLAGDLTRRRRSALQFNMRNREIVRPLHPCAMLAITRCIPLRSIFPRTLHRFRLR